MKKIVSIFLMALGLFSLMLTNLTVAAAEELQTEYDQVVDYISKHLDEFRKEYNKDRTLEPLRATSVEKHCLVYIIDSNEYGVYLDFNDNRGYLVSSLNYELYAINTTEDLDYLKNIDFTYYSTIDGFLYHNGKSFQKYNEKIVIQEDKVYGYEGQGDAGESDIYDIDEYMASRYPSYKLEESQEKATENVTYNATRMLHTSFYVKYVSKDGGYNYTQIKSENNCALNAAFNVMSSWVQMRIYGHLAPKTLTRNINDSIKEDLDYQYYGTGEETVGHDFYWTVNSSSLLSKMPEMYYQMRLYAVEKHNYSPESGLKTEEIKSSMERMMDYYNYNITFNTSTNFSDVISSLQEGRAVFMGISNSIAYSNNHAVALLGYRKYSYKTGAWIFQKTNYAYFFVIDDGQHIIETYFDPNCNSKLSYEFIY